MDSLRSPEVGNYILGSRLGWGGTSCVYQAHHPLLGRDVAVKILNPEFIGEPSVEHLFLREGRIMASVPHPGVPQVYDVGRTFDGAPYLVLELLEGRSLSEIRNQEWPARARMECLTRVARTLAAVHEAGFIHCDVKAENIMLRDASEPRSARLLDFGVAMLRNETRQDLLVGTPRCMAPEQIRNRPCDYRVDVWAFGVLMFELLVGNSPFAADGCPANETLRRVLYELPAPIPPTLPGELRRLILACLRKESDERPPSMRGIASKLELVASAEGKVPNAPTVHSGKKHRRTARGSDMQLTRLPLALGETICIRAPTRGCGPRGYGRSWIGPVSIPPLGSGNVGKPRLQR